MKWFNNLKVSIKIISACSIFIIIIIGISADEYFNLKSSDVEFDSFYADRFIASLDLNEMQQSFLRIKVNMLLQQRAAEKNDLKEIERLIEDNKNESANYKKYYENYSSTYMTSEEKAMVDEFINKVKITAESRIKFSDALLARNSSESIKYLNEWISGREQASGMLDNLIHLQVSEGKVILDNQTENVRRTNFILLAILLISLITGTIVTIILSRSVSGPVKKGLAFAQLIAVGDFTKRIDLDQKDELGQLGKALNTSADNLEKLISEIIIASQNLVRSVEEIASGNENLSQRTSEQASSLEEIAATVEEANASTRQNAGNAGEANNLAESSSRLAENGGQIVEKAVSSIGEINSSSKKIAEIINIINEISFQTNLLALNAAVEAARAGEQGRGFAVVAGEVRNLAQRSAGASKEIGALIKDSIAKIDEGTDLVNMSGDALKEIIQSVRQVKDIISEIAAASDEQSRGINQIATAVTEMDTMTQQNAALVEETAAASEEMSNQAQVLLSMVQKFKIRGALTFENQAVVNREIHLHSMQSKKSNEKPAEKNAGKTEKKYSTESGDYEMF